MTVRKIGALIIATCLTSLAARPATCQRPTQAAPKPPTPTAQVVLVEKSLGMSIVGVNPATRRDLSAVVSLVVLGKRSSFVDEPAIQLENCLQNEASLMRRQFVDSVQRMIEAIDQDTTPAALTRMRAARQAGVQNLLGDLSSMHRSGLRRCSPADTAATRQVNLGLFTYICEHDSDAAPCPDARPAYSETRRSIMLVFLVAHLGTQKENGPPALQENSVLVSMPAGGADRYKWTTSAALIRTLADTFETPRALLEQQAQKAFELAVAKARANGRTLSAAGLAITQVPRQVALQTLDIVRDLPTVLEMLPDQAKAALADVSDELARSRLSECVRMLGKEDANVIGTCAGYDVTAAQVVGCLGRARCNPTAIRAQAQAAAIAMVTNAGSKLAESMMPRVLSATRTIDSVDALVEKCLGSAGGERNRAMRCVGEQLKTESVRKYEGCLQPSLRHNGKQVAECVVTASGATLPPRAASVLQCAQSGIPASRRALCAVPDSIRGKVAEAVACANQLKNQNFGCLAGRHGPRLDSARACMSQRNDSAQFALCIAPLIDGLSKEASLIASCVGSSTELVSAAVCASSGQMSPDTQRALRCIADSQGDPFGAGVCMASDQLNAYQRTALQCAAMTGGEPVSFASCAGGRLLVMRIQGCLQDDFASGRCFGPNNDFRKALRALLGTDIKQGTPVATIANAGVDVMRGAVTFSTDVLKDPLNIQSVAKAMERYAAHQLNAAYTFQKKAVEQTGEAVERGVRCFGRKIRFSKKKC